MRLTRQQFTKLLKNNRLAISLIGMSNIGKTYWSNKFALRNFKHISCDSLIEQKLADKLLSLGYNGIADVARWMGQPYQARFLSHQATYLRFEKQVISDLIRNISAKPPRNVVIDTTGSFAHIGPKLSLGVKKHSFIIYIQATPSMQKQMFKKYLANPKPVVWSSVFKKQRKQSNRGALRNCYPRLLKLRSQRYAKYADVTIPRSAIHKGMTIAQFIALIKKYL